MNRSELQDQLESIFADASSIYTCYETTSQAFFELAETQLASIFANASQRIHIKFRDKQEDEEEDQEGNQEGDAGEDQKGDFE